VRRPRAWKPAPGVIILADVIVGGRRVTATQEKSACLPTLYTLYIDGQQVGPSESLKREIISRYEDAMTKAEEKYL
jgi:hypothetical protein